MATVTDLGPLADVDGTDVPLPITSAMYFEMVEKGVIPEDRPVYLWDGELFLKMAKTHGHAAIYNALSRAIERRLPRGYHVGHENPVRLGDRHTPLPDMVVLRGEPLDFLDRQRYPDHREVVLVAEVAVTSLPRDLGERLSRYALALPDAIYLVVDVKNRRLVIHNEARAGLGEYGRVETVGPGGILALTIGGIDLEPIPFEELMR